MYCRIDYSVSCRLVSNLISRTRMQSVLRNRLEL